MPIPSYIKKLMKFRNNNLKNNYSWYEIGLDIYNLATLTVVLNIKLFCLSFCSFINVFLNGLLE